MSFDGCIVTQIHIPDFDVQGQLAADYKLWMLDNSIKHLRKYNPNSFIILIGHGHSPHNSTTRMCDEIIWENKLYELDENGYVKDMPAQYKSVSLGVKAAYRNGFGHILKTRADCVHMIPNICDYCNKILDEEKKDLLLTQMTGLQAPKLGDCFMYGNINILDCTWDYRNPIRNTDGLKQIGLSFLDKCGWTNDWNELLKTTCSFRDVNELKYIDLRRNIRLLKAEDILDNNIDVDKYHWGSSNGWIKFDENQNMIVGQDEYHSRKSFYNL